MTEQDRHRSHDRERQAACGSEEHAEPRRVAQRTWSAVLRGLGVACLALFAVACSSEQQEQAEVKQPPAVMSGTVEPETSKGQVLLPEAGAGSVSGDWPVPTLASMYAHHPERMFSAEQQEGVVSIEPPCVYFYSDRDGLSADGAVRRIALSLSYPRMRFDESTQTLWNGDIPISHGDRVLTGGADGRSTQGGKEPHELHLFWNACAAQGAGSAFGLESVEWYCAQEPPDWPTAKQGWQRICVEDTRPWNQRELLEQRGLAPAVNPPAAGLGPGEPPPEAELVPPPFFGMHPYHPDMELQLAKLVGILSIELAGPNDYERVCAYLYPTAATAPQSVLRGDSWKHAGPDGQPLAVRLDLPYPQARFDEDTWTLWNGDIGPMATGDLVIADPIAPPDFNDNGYGKHKQPQEPVINDPCDKTNARAAVMDIQTVEHYCTHDPPTRHRTQCEQAMSQNTQHQNHLTPPAGQRRNR
jgi:hypothetical protein